MIKNWLQAPDLSGIELNDLPSHSFGKQLAVHRLTQKELKKAKLALVGIDATFAKKTREALYSLSWNFHKLNIADLGDVRKASPDFIIPFLRELQSSGIIPILIGADASTLRAQYQSFQEIQRHVSVAVVDQQISISPEPSKEKNYSLNPAVYNKKNRFYHLSHLGAQQHQVDPAVFNLLADHHYDCVRLGAARQNMQELEPIIRDADLLGFDIGAIKYFEAPAQMGHHPSGFNLEEATQLCRYAGISDKLQSFGIYGIDAAADETKQSVTAAAYAQLIWYFIDGFVDRKGDFPVTAKGLTEYVVDLKDFDRITFWKSPRSGRWWIQAPAGKKNGEERHRLIPCSYQDYQDACKQQLPDRLIQAFKRFS